jgi:N-acetylglucosaminyl-diphospho-decaprenol L-rhamnosyltransferase
VTEVSVVIPSWNTREHLRACLESLKTTLPMSSEIIVVDNASHDGSAKMVAEEFKHVRLVRNPRNMGFAHAINQGIDRARGAYVLFLNSDTHVVGNAIKHMIGFLERNLRHGAVVPRLLNPDGTTQKLHMRFPTLKTVLWVGTPLLRWAPNSRESQRYMATDFDYENDGDVEQPSAVCLLMRRKALRSSRPLDESLWLFFNDVDLCKRLAKEGWKLGYLSSARVYHSGGVSTRQFAEFGAEYHKNRLAFYRKHHGRVAGLFVKLCMAWSVADHCVRELCRRAEGLPEEPLQPLFATFASFLRA